MSYSYKHDSATAMLHHPHVHMAFAVILLAITLWLSVLMVNDYPASTMSSSKYPKVIMFVHSPTGRVFVCALWLIVGMLVAKCICHHYMMMQK